MKGDQTGIQVSSTEPRAGDQSPGLDGLRSPPGDVVPQRALFAPAHLVAPASGSLDIHTKDVPETTRRLLNRSQRRIADAAQEMATADEQQIEFIHSTFASVGLPRSAVDGRTYERTCGKASLRVEAGSIWDGHSWIEQPVPFGAKPRTLMVYLTTYAVRHRTKLVPVGGSFSEFLRMLGETYLTGGERGSLTAYRKQIAALSAATIRLGIPTRKGVLTSVAQPIKRFELWYSKHEDGQRPLWPGEITLSNDYYESILEHAFPIDARALYALSASAMAMDIYLWLASRLWRVGQKSAFVPWSALFIQFGKDGDVYVNDKSRYQNLLRNFRKDFLTYLKRVKAVYPDANVAVARGGLVLCQSNPPVARARSLGFQPE